MGKEKIDMSVRQLLEDLEDEGRPLRRIVLEFDTAEDIDEDDEDECDEEDEEDEEDDLEDEDDSDDDE